MSLTPEWFAQHWEAASTGGGSGDPWDLEAGWYEQRKRAITAASLPAARYRRAFEPGCARGALSALLAGRCDELLCWDVADRAVDAARDRLAPWPGARAERGAVPFDVPPGRFDLVVVAEMAYYLDADDRDALWRSLEGCLEPGGTLLAVHWLREAPDHPVDGATVHSELLARPALAPLASHVEADFRLDVLVAGPRPAPSVAERTGLR